LKNVQYWLRSRKAKISTAGIYVIFRGLKFEPDTEIRQKGALFKGLDKKEIILPCILKKNFAKNVWIAARFAPWGP
jgi:hypothetical protein